MLSRFQVGSVSFRSLAGAICVLGPMTSLAIAQSGSRVVYPQRSTMQSIPTRSPTTQGSMTQGSVTQGPVTQGSVTQGSVTQGSVTQGSVTQGSVTQGSAMQGRMRAGQETFESKFWRYLQDSHYRQWAPVAGTTGDAYAGQSPHGAMLKMYLNRLVAGRPDVLPEGSVIVKENFGPDGKQLMAITTMYRPKGYRGWYWTKYNPDGSVASKDGNRLAGKVQGCIDCHSSAGGDDQVFFND